MATHSSILAWEIPWTEEPGGLQSMESQRVGHDIVTEHAHTYHLPSRVSPPTCFTVVGILIILSYSHGLSSARNHLVSS